jgi:hypothetical protein
VANASHCARIGSDCRKIKSGSRIEASPGRVGNPHRRTYGTRKVGTNIDRKEAAAAVSRDVAQRHEMTVCDAVGRTRPQADHRYARSALLQSFPLRSYRSERYRRRLDVPKCLVEVGRRRLLF